MTQTLHPPFCSLPSFLSQSSPKHTFLFFFLGKRESYFSSQTPRCTLLVNLMLLCSTLRVLKLESQIFFLIACFLSHSLFSNSFFSSYYFLKVMQSARLPLLWSPSVQLCAANPNVASKVPIESSEAKKREAF